MLEKLFLLVSGLLFIGGSLALASQGEVRLLKTLSLSDVPRQVEVAADGLIYVLTEQGEVQLFSRDAERIGAFEVGPDVTGLTVQGNNRLILEMAEQKQLLLVSLEQRVEIDIAGSPTLGAENAPVSIVVFDDFQCPYCARTAPLLKQVLEAYSGQVRLVYKQFPLSMHKYAKAAAIASLAAQRQGKFWEMHDLLFANHNQLNTEKINQLAATAGLDLERFQQDLSDPRLQQRVAADQQLGKSIGVRGTPTIFINGRLLSQRNRAGFDRIIKEELAGSIKVRQ